MYSKYLIRTVIISLTASGLMIIFDWVVSEIYYANFKAHRSISDGMLRLFNTSLILLFSLIFPFLNKFLKGALTVLMMAYLLYYLDTNPLKVSFDFLKLLLVLSLIPLLNVLYTQYYKKRWLNWTKDTQLKLIQSDEGKLKL